MSVLSRLFDFTPSTLIQSGQIDSEFNQLVDILSGVSTDKNVVISLDDGTLAPLRLNQTGLGPLLLWAVGGVGKGTIDNFGRFNSLLTTGTAPITVLSTTVCPNLNADLLDGVEGASYATLTGSQTLTNKTLTSPRINQILDSNGNELIIFTTTASAIDELTIANANGGFGPSIAASGGSSIIDIQLIPKNASGKVAIGTPGATPSSGMLGSADASGTDIGGGALILHGGKGTGTGVPGFVGEKMALITTTGTAAHALSSTTSPYWKNLWSHTNQDVAINGASPTSMIGALLGTTQIQGGGFRVGQRFRLKAIGNVLGAAGRSLTLTLTLGGTTVATFATPIGALEGGTYSIFADVTVRALSGSNNIRCHKLSIQFRGDTGIYAFTNEVQASATVATTSNASWQLNASWDSTSGGPTLTSEMTEMDYMNR
jgi:hypothetical protein